MYRYVMTLSCPDRPGIVHAVAAALLAADANIVENAQFGDDAAAAGGLVVWDDEGPCFCADAVADPLTGLLAATAASIVLATGGRRLVDVALARTAAAVAVAVPGAA
jgi:hypothetical protein